MRWNDFVPASDQLLRNKIAPEARRRSASSSTSRRSTPTTSRRASPPPIQSGTGPDIICALNNWPQLYAESIADVSDIAEEIGKAQGGFYETSKIVASDGKKWIAVPWCIVGVALIAYRKSWFAEIGYRGKFPETWESYIATPARS